MDVETLHEYNHIFKRLSKLNKSMIRVAEENVRLKEANRKLRDNEHTYLMRLAAWERLNPTVNVTDIYSSVSE